MASYLSDYIETGQLEFIIPQSPEIVIDIFGYNILLTHGDTVRGWSGIPYYGVDRQKAKQQALRRKNGGFDYWFLGHFHTPTELEGNTYINGALVGPDEYAKNILHLSSEPIQKLFVFDANYGITAMFNLNAREADEHPFLFDYVSKDGKVLFSPTV